MLGQLLMFWHPEKNPWSELGDCDKDFHENCQISVTDNGMFLFMVDLTHLIRYMINIVDFVMYLGRN